MNKNLDDVFNMATETKEKVEETKEVAIIDRKNIQVTDVNQYILDLGDVSQHSIDMDSLAVKAMEGYEEIMDFARESDPRTVGQVLQAAVSMHKNAMDAKESKIKASLQAANLILRKKAMDDKKVLGDADVIHQDEDGTVTGDRNKILDAIKDM